MIEYDENLDRMYGFRFVDDRTVEKTATLGTKTNYDSITAICKHFINHPDPTVVPIYNFTVIEEKPAPIGGYGSYKYSYQMKRLGMLNQDEKDLIYWARENRWSNEGVGPRYIDKLNQLKESYPELFNFVDNAITVGRYLDLHSGNILKDEDESYRFIDLEGFINGPLDRIKNNWITR